VLEEGRLTDSQGRLATFSETVVIMTSNLGSKHMLVPVIGEHERELVLGEVHRFFRPEFLNRLDEIILFHQLSGDQLALILELMLKKELQLAGKQGIRTELTDAAKTWLLAQNDNRSMGHGRCAVSSPAICANRWPIFYCAKGGNDRRTARPPSPSPPTKRAWIFNCSC
jgi:ATP-dependent Clp protease ATP-binding subunit ClpA